MAAQAGDDENALEKSVKQLEEEITCAVCQGHYVEPKVLPCCHYYCKQCIHTLASRKGVDQPFSCPECRKEALLPQGNVDNLQSAFFVNRMKEVHSTLEQAHSTDVVQVNCEVCSQDKACAFCRHCDHFICISCVNSHKRMKRTFSGHKVVSLTELKEGGAKEIFRQDASIELCKTHEQPLRIYCFDCSSLICQDCIVKTHSVHNHEFIKVAAPEVREKLKQKLGQLKQIKENLSCAVEKVHSTNSEIEAQRVSVEEYIRNSISQLYEIIENYEQELITSVSEKASQKTERLLSQEKTLSAVSSAVQSMIDHAEQCIKQADADLMSSYADVQSRLDREIEDQQKEEKNLEPVEEVDVGVEVASAEKLKQLCQVDTKIVQLPLDPKKCTLALDRSKVIEVNKSAELQLVTRLSNGMPTKQQCTVECHLKTLTTGSTSTCEVESIGGGSVYRISYTPIAHGPSELTVTVNGQEVEGSPFTFFVYIQPGQLGKPISSFSGFSNPRDVALTSTRNIIVTEKKGIVVLDENGVKLNSYKSSAYKITDLFCVAVDCSTDGSIYITGNSITAHKIVKLNCNFEQVAEFSSKEKLHFRGLTIVGDKIVVCQRDRGVVVFTKELEFMREIVNPQKTHSSQQFGGVRDVSSDQDGNLYISDYDNSCILVFRKDGEYVRSFGSDENDVNRLKGPRGVWVAGGYVYVANWHSHSVSVFTTQGAHMTSFGLKGSSEGAFKNPWGLCVDKDGFVYVCDQKNNKVHKYFSNYS